MVEILEQEIKMSKSSIDHRYNTDRPRAGVDKGSPQ